MIKTSINGPQCRNRVTSLLGIYDDIPRDGRGRFLRGKPGGPGRPRGSFTKIKVPLGFLRDAVANWERYGDAAFMQLMRTDPLRYFHLMIAIESGEFRVERRRRAKDG
jgi:hypothetical protein